MNLLDIFEGREPHQQAIDKLEHRRIEDLEAKMDDYAKRGMKDEFQKCKAERDSYYKVKTNEGSMKHMMHKDAERMSREAFCEKYGDEHGEFWDNINLDEAAMGQPQAQQMARPQTLTPHQQAIMKDPRQAAADKAAANKAARLQAIKDNPYQAGADAAKKRQAAKAAMQSTQMEDGIGQDIADKSEKMARATPQTKAGAVASTVKHAARWLAGKGGPGKEGPTYEGADDIADRSEYDQEGDMVKDNLHTIRREAQRLEKILSNNENVPEWVQDKLAQVKGMMTASSEYMQTQRERDHEEHSGEEGVTIAEKLKGLPSKKLGSARDLGKSVRKFRAQRGLEEAGTADQWSKEGEWKSIPKAKSGKTVDPRGEVTHLSDVARREAERKADQKKKF